MVRVGPYWLQLVWTFLFAVPIALLFTVMGFALHGDWSVWVSGSAWARWYGINLFVSAFISFGIHFWFELVTRVIGLPRWRSWSMQRKGWASAAIAMSGTLWAWPLGVSLAGFKLRWFEGGASLTNVSATWLVFVVLFSGLMWVYFDGRMKAEAAERRATEAQLRLLQGQIEPHFLFNTLANVLSLLEADPARARAMLEAFVDYLRSSFGGLRHGQHTLAQELALVEAYLRVVGLRMDERLRWQVDVPAELAGLPLPPLLLQPLVENAIHHGLEPKIEGGEVRLQATRQGDTLVLTVDDDGLGLPDSTGPRQPGQRSALQNVRERLQQTWGQQASLQLRPRQPSGVRAELRLPCPGPSPAPIPASR